MASPSSPLRLVAGLGNPGPDYAATRHNAGFWFCERLAERLGARFQNESRFHGDVARVPGSDIRLLKPDTFMNRSGQAIGAMARFFRIPPDAILVIHDELDIPPGQLRLKCGGGHGGHNGLKDTDAHLGSRDYWRLRIGIGHPGERSEVIGFVLKPPRLEEQHLIDDAIDRALERWPDLAAGRWDAATRTLNQKPRKPKTDAP